MLGKLIKNEIKSSAYTMANIYIATLVTIGIMVVSYLVKLAWLRAIATIALLAISVVILVMTVLGILTNFNKSLYGNQGYLSFTLPVKTGSLLASKAIVSVLWLALSYVVFVGLMVGIYLYLIGLVGDNTINIIKQIVEMFRELPSTGAIRMLLIFMVATLFIFSFMIISVIYFAVTLANTRPFQKMVMVYTVVIAFVTFIVIYSLYGVLTNNVPLSLVMTGDSVTFRMVAMTAGEGILSFGLTGNLFLILAAGILMYLTGTLMKTKVNIK